MSENRQPVICLLPGGYVDDDGETYNEVELYPLTGQEEEFLVYKNNTNTASLISSILSRCISRIGPMKIITEKITRRLLVADRQYLILKLREITFGDRIQAVIRCPWPDCGQKVDVDFSTHDIPVINSDEKGPVYSMKLSEEAAWNDSQGKPYRNIRFRLPNGGDQEIVSPIVIHNEAKALSMLLERCIQAIGPVATPGKKEINRFSPRARMEIEKKMQSVAPKIELTMEANCPECARGFAIPFDLQEFFFGELESSRELLHREIHYLAYNYHWSEREILAMPREKRRKYIEILADEIERMNDAI